MRPITPEAYAGMLCGGVISSALQCEMHGASLLCCHVEIAGSGVQASLTIGTDAGPHDMVEILPVQVAYLVDTSRCVEGRAVPVVGRTDLVIRETDQSAVEDTLDSEQALEYGFLHAELILQASGAGETLGFACVYRQIRELPEIGIWVAPGSRGLGIGRALATAVLAQASSSVPCVNWATLESNTVSRALVPASAVVYEARIVTEGVPAARESHRTGLAEGEILSGGD
jgi:GNAT superfamily N-acetyltransferase